ncbi:MAG: hypothetical protein ABIH23_12910 [bacterium]
MNAIGRFKNVLVQGAIVLLVACVLSHWAVSSAVLQKLAQTDQARVKALMGHEEWLDERGMFATPPREQWTWGILLVGLALTKLVRAIRSGGTDFMADVVCTVLGTLIGVLLAFAGHTLTYGTGMVLRGEMVITGLLYSTIGLGGGMVLSGVARLLNAECGMRSAE